MEKNKCPVCDEISVWSESSKGNKFYSNYECPRCGSYKVDIADENALNHTLKHKFAAISHFIRKGYIKRWTSGTTQFDITHDIFEKELRNAKQPTPFEQADNLILYLGSELLEPFYSHADSIDLDQKLEIKLCAIIGCKDIQGLYYIIQHLKDNLINFIITEVEMGNRPSVKTASIGLSFDGWQKYEELKEIRINSKQVFMAMKYNDDDLDYFYNNFLKEGIKNVGLELVRLDEVGKAGLIDNNMRAEIKKSCLLLADLTHDNNGAYWEAGFAEGLGMPVIYLCEKNKFDEQKTHFDTNHCTTIIWEKGKETEAIHSLQSTIMLSIPNKAK